MNVSNASPSAATGTGQLVLAGVVQLVRGATRRRMTALTPSSLVPSAQQSFPVRDILTFARLRPPAAESAGSDVCSSDWRRSPVALNDAER